MGREKRLSEARTRDLTDKKARPAQPAPTAAGEPLSATVATVPVTSPARDVSAARMILQVILLYLLPISLIVLFGKLVLGL